MLIGATMQWKRCMVRYCSVVLLITNWRTKGTEYSRICLERPQNWPQKCGLSRQVVSGDRFSYIECGSFCRKCMVCQGRWSLMAVVSQDRFQCNLFSTKMYLFCLLWYLLKTNELDKIVPVLSCLKPSLTRWWPFRLLSNPKFSIVIQASDTDWPFTDQGWKNAMIKVGPVTRYFQPIIKLDYLPVPSALYNKMSPVDIADELSRHPWSNAAPGRRHWMQFGNIPWR